MDRRVAIIRFWLLCLAALAVVACCPEIGVALWPVAFLFPSCVCCGTGCETYCNPTYGGQIQIVLTGIADAACTNCEVFNATWVATYGAAGTCSFTHCPWTYTQDIVDAFACSFGMQITAQVRESAGTYYLKVVLMHIRSRCSFGGNPGRNNWENNLGGTAPDCSAWASESVTWISDEANDLSGTLLCDGSASTCLVTAL